MSNRKVQHLSKKRRYARDVFDVMPRFTFQRLCFAMLVVVQSIETGVAVPRTLKTNTATCLTLFGKMGLGLKEVRTNWIW